MDRLQAFNKFKEEQDYQHAGKLLRLSPSHCRSFEHAGQPFGIVLSRSDVCLRTGEKCLPYTVSYLSFEGDVMLISEDEIEYIEEENEEQIHSNQ